MNRRCAKVELLEIGEGSEMEMIFSELSCFGEVGMVMKDGDVGRRSTIPWSYLFTPSREAGVREPHLLEEVLLAAVQPLCRDQGAVLEGCGPCRCIVSDAIDYFVHDFLGELDSHDGSRVLANEGTSGGARRGLVG